MVLCYPEKQVLRWFSLSGQFTETGHISVHSGAAAATFAGGWPD
jgi:hypothetical protein